MFKQPLSKNRILLQHSTKYLEVKVINFKYDMDCPLFKLSIVN